jgi:hypothetical protein
LCCGEHYCKNHYSRFHVARLLPSPDRRFKLHKRSQLFLGTLNETFSVIAVCIYNPDCSPVRVHSCDAVPTPSGFAEIVCGLSNRAFFQSNAVVDAIFGRRFLDRLSH